MCDLLLVPCCYDCYDIDKLYLDRKSVKRFLLHQFFIFVFSFMIIDCAYLHVYACICMYEHEHVYVYL